jgi:plastocyanin
VPVICALLLAGACGKPEIVVRSEGGEGPGWFSLVVDVEANAGAGLSLATDADGNPHLAYLALPEEPAAGEEAPTPDPEAPTLPAVMHAHLVQDVWTRSPVADEQGIDETSTTAIAVDAEGVHHVVWTAGGQILHSSNAEGEFAEPDVVAEGNVQGVSITVDDRGAPWVAFWDLLTEAEGPAALIRVATQGPEGWEVQTAAEADSPEPPVSTGIGLTAEGPAVAFGSGGQTIVALQQGRRWVSETVDPEGGAGVAMAVDASGVPHLAYLDGAGRVKHAHPAGQGWEVSVVGEGATDAAASIAVDQEGLHHVTWQTAEGIAYANNAEGAFAAEELPPVTAAGAIPRVAAGAEGTVYLAFADTEDTELQMAVRAEEEPLLAVPSPEEQAPGGGTTTGPAPCEPAGAELAIAAQNLAFDTDCLAAPAGEPFTIEFDNRDTVPHNVAIYPAPPPSEALFTGDVFSGPSTETYQVDPIEEEGNLYFQCDVHPNMNGTFVVALAEGGGGGGGGGS